MFDRTEAYQLNVVQLWREITVTRSTEALEVEGSRTWLSAEKAPAQKSALQVTHGLRGTTKIAALA